MDIDLSEWPQPSFESVFNSHARYLIVYGSAAAGKTYAVVQKVIIRALKYPKSHIVVFRKHGIWLRRSCFRYLIEHIENKGIPCSINQTTMTLTFPNGSIIECIPIVHSLGEPADRLKSLTDIDTIWIEEAANDTTQEVFEMLELRLRGQPLKDNYRQLILTFNPININNWIYNYFFVERKSDSDVDIQRYTYKDNAFLDAEFVKKLESQKDPNLYTVYTLGEWGRLENQVYSNYHDELFGYDYNDYEATICGVDFGWEHPNAFVLLGIKEKQLYVIDELYCSKTLNVDFIRAIKKKLDEHIVDKRLHRMIPMYCDTARPELITEMKKAGLNVYPAKKDVLDGISVVRQLEIIVNPRAMNFLKEIQGYVRQKDRDGNVQELPDKQRGFDHLMDATRYAIYTYTILKRRQPHGVNPIVVKPRGGRGFAF